jgi:MarR family transcriptional regulator for hemolysin
MNNSTKILASGQQMKRLYEKQFEEICRRYQITQNEVDIIIFLANNTDFDTARDIVEIRMIAKSYISKSVEYLIKKGFLVRFSDKEDRRIVHLQLTDKSIPIIDNARFKQNEFVKILFAGMNADEIEMFESLLNKIFTNASIANNQIE